MDRKPTQKEDITKLKHQLLCPECHKTLRVRYDEKHDETYCTNCGLILRCPPGNGFCPEVKEEGVINTKQQTQSEMWKTIYK